MTGPLALEVVTRWEVGGAQETVIELCRKLPETGWRSLAAGGIAGSADSAGAEIARGAGLELIELAHMRREISPIGDLRALVELYKLIRRLEPEVVHTHSSKAGILGRAAARIAGTPRIVHTVHGWSFSAYTGSSHKLFILLERALARWTDDFCFVAQSDLDAAASHRIGHIGKHHLVRSAIDLERFSSDERSQQGDIRDGLQIPPEAELIVSVTRLAPQKAPDVLMKTLELTLRSHQSAHAVVIADGPTLDDLKSSVAESDLAGRLHLLGGSRAVPEWLRSADVFLLTDKYGGLPRAIVEALASGTPVVTTSFAGVPEVVLDGQNGYLAPIGDDVALCEHLLKILRDAALREQLASSARRSVFGFSADAMVSATTEIYNGGP